MSVVESWFPAAVAEPLPKLRSRKRPSASVKSKAQRRPVRNIRVRASVVWMVVFAVMLVGVVTLNVAVMRAHVSVNDLDAKITRLQQANASLAAKNATATAAPRIARKAHADGQIPAPGSAITVIEMSGR
jgi:hypothetical protein